MKHSLRKIYPNHLISLYLFLIYLSKKTARTKTAHKSQTWTTGVEFLNGMEDASGGL